MKLHNAEDNRILHFTGHGEGFFMVSGQSVQIASAGNFIVLPDRIIERWTTASLSTLGEADARFLLDLKAEVILLGTGATFGFPAADWRQRFLSARIGLEVMANDAVCRTYNILAAEGRRVAAALLV